MTYYNEFDPKAAAWLRELIRAGHIPAGDVDERSISDIRPDELTRYRQQHFFAGIGGWAFALRLAGWDDDRPVRTGSCPCQPFSAAGKGLGEADARHLWPVFRDLITFGEPTITFGEQVASAPGRIWLARVRADLEGLGYGVGAADLCSAGVGSPNIRQRLFWMAHAKGQRRHGPQRREEWTGRALASGDRRPCRLSYTNGDGCAEHVDEPGQRAAAGPSHAAERCGPSGGMADMHGERCEERAECDGEPLESRQQAPQRDDALRCSGVVRLGDPDQQGSQGRLERGHGAGQWTPWAASVVLPCTDGKSRRIEPGSFPLAHGVPGRVGLLRGYGNAINPWLAAEFILACEEALN